MLARNIAQLKRLSRKSVIVSFDDIVELNIKKAAEGDLAAQCALADMYLHGTNGVAKD